MFAGYAGGAVGLSVSTGIRALLPNKLYCEAKSKQSHWQMQAASELGDDSKKDLDLIHKPHVAWWLTEAVTSWQLITNTDPGMFCHQAPDPYPTSLT